MSVNKDTYQITDEKQGALLSKCENFDITLIICSVTPIHRRI